MNEVERDSVNLISISTIENANNVRLNLERVSVDSSYVLDVFDEVYSNRVHQKCLNISYFTLLSMTLSVIFWVLNWLASNRCGNTDEPKLKNFLCALVTIFESITFILIGISPFLFLFMIYSWINYSCYNPMDAIRVNSKFFKIEDDQWKAQLDNYYTKKKLKCFNFFRRKQMKELYERGYGYLFLSSHGIVIDELLLLSAKKNIIDKGTLSNDNKLLKLTFKKTCLRPWKIHIDIYLPDNNIQQNDIEQLQQLFQIETNNDITSSSSSV